VSLDHSPTKIAKRSFTVSEWTAMRGYSRVFFYTLKKRGDAPDTIGRGKAQRVTIEADARWLRKQEQKARRARRAG
jgi:hypothetical protein